MDRAGNFLSSTCCAMNFSSSRTAALYGSAGGTEDWAIVGSGIAKQKISENRKRMVIPLEKVVFVSTPAYRKVDVVSYSFFDWNRSTRRNCPAGIRHMLRRV